MTTNDPKRKWRVLPWMAPTAFTLLFVVLNVLAFEAFALHQIVVLAGIVGGGALIYSIVPRSIFLSLALTNGLVLYTWFYYFFTRLNFARTSHEVIVFTYPLPIAAFIIGVLVWRREILGWIAAGAATGSGDILAKSRWLIPLAVIGALTFIIPDLELIQGQRDIPLLVAQLLVSVSVFFSARQACAFLVLVGQSFESLFARLRHLAVAIFAFATFYSLLVLGFACVYRIIDLATPSPQFLIGGKAQVMGIMESAYFSLITMSTVGYGDIVPVGPAVRFVALVQILCGVLLLLFGFSEIMRHTEQNQTQTKENSS
jgi:voltage-gated potassium channel